MMLFKYKIGDWGYVWPVPGKNPKRFHICLHWPDGCESRESETVYPNGVTRVMNSPHKDMADHSKICEDATELGIGAEVTVIDDDISYTCKIIDMFRHAIANCSFIIYVEVIS